MARITSNAIRHRFRVGIASGGGVQVRSFLPLINFTRKKYLELYKDDSPVVASGRNSNRHTTLVEAAEHASEHSAEIGQPGDYEIRIGTEVYYVVKINQVILDHTVDPPAAATQAELSLSASSYSHDENVANATFTVLRAENTSERVSVDWAVINANVTPSSGTVTFEIGDSQKLVTVATGEVGPTEVGTLSLSNPQNLSGGLTPAIVAPSSASFTILDSVFPLSVHISGSYLIDSQNNPFLINGDTPWSLVAQLTNSEIDTYLDNTAAKGFNSILINAPEYYYTSQSPTYRNIDGVDPFNTMTDFASGLTAYWNRVDYVVDECKTRNMVVLINPAYWGFSPNTDGWGDLVAAESDADLQSYGAALANRYTQGNVLWCLGGDNNMSSSQRDKQWNIVTGIRSVRTTDIITAHGYPRNHAGTGEAFTYWNGQTGFNLNNIYDQDTTSLYDLAETADARALPFILLETRYEGEPGTPVSAQELRRAVYTALLSGACGHFYGNNPIWHFESPNTIFSYSGTWESHLDDTARSDMAHVKALFDAYNWHLLVPKQDSSLVTSGLGSGTSRISPALSSDGNFAFIWKSASGSVTVDMTNFTPSSVRARFYNPADGSYLLVSGSPFTNSGVQNITFPGERILVLDAQQGNTINAASASQGDVEAAISSAVTGDTVQVPAGSANWTGLILNKAITLSGVGDATNITLNQCSLVKQSTGNVRVTNFRFNRDSGLGASNLGGWIITGAESDPSFIFDNISSYSDAVMYELKTNGGLFHTMTVRSQGNPNTGAAHIVPKFATGSTSSWQSDPIYGTDAPNGVGVTYIENCVVYGVNDDGSPYGSNSVMSMIDMDGASRIVIRNCDLYETTINSHGEATSQTSHRHFEIYDNNHYYRNQQVNRSLGYIWLRGGSGLMYNNYFDNPVSSEWSEASIKLSIRTVDEVKYPCGYPHTQQLGWGWDEGLAQEVAEGIYWYNNTFEAGTSSQYTDPPNFVARAWGNGCTNDLWTDYILPIWNETTKPGYTALQYPHPLRN